MEEWFQWSKEQQRDYVTALDKITLNDAKQKKPIKEQNNSIKFSKTPVQTLSVKLSIALQSLVYADTIEKKALELLNLTNTIVLAPCLKELPLEK